MWEFVHKMTNRWDCWILDQSVIYCQSQELKVHMMTSRWDCSVLGESALECQPQARTGASWPRSTDSGGWDWGVSCDSEHQVASLWLIVYIYCLLVDHCCRPQWLTTVTYSSHYRTWKRFWPYLDSLKIAWRYVQRFMSYRDDKPTNRQTNTHTNTQTYKQSQPQTQLKTIPPSLTCWWWFNISDVLVGSVCVCVCVFVCLFVCLSSR